MNDLFARCQGELPQFMTFWEEIVNIDSGSGDTKGLRTVASLLETRLTASGFSLSRVYAKGDDSEYNIVATKEGTGTKSFLLMAHMDTVFPAGTVAERPFSIQGDWAFGPGVADCKVGIVAMLHIAAILDAGDYKRLTFLFNCDEEITSPSSKDVVIAEGKKHDYIFSFEPGGQGDKICLARKGNAKIKLVTHGKNSHAGTHPDSGINALTEMAWQLDRMRNLGDRAKKTTVTFTKVVCGDRINVVPDLGEAWADVRVAEPAELTRLENDLKKLTSERILPDSRVEASLIVGRPPFPQNDATDKLVALAASIYGELGLPLEAEAVGGVGDINFAYTSGAACLCRLAPPVGGPGHCIEESVYIPAVAPRMYLSVRLIRELNGK